MPFNPYANPNEIVLLFSFPWWENRSSESLEKFSEVTLLASCRERIGLKEMFWFYHEPLHHIAHNRSPGTACMNLTSYLSVSFLFILLIICRFCEEQAGRRACLGLLWCTSGTVKSWRITGLWLSDENVIFPGNFCSKPQPCKCHHIKL